jgi:uncharacterized protein (DUF1330 family)
MIYITQLIYIVKGQELVFDQFESVAIPLISRYNGQLLIRCRPSPDTILENSTEVPYEIHLVQFNEESDFDSFMKDEERKKFLHLKEQSIKSVLLVKGTKL